MPKSHFDNTYHVSAANGLAYFGSSVDNKVYALDINNGALLWSAPARDICAGRADCQPGLSAASTSIPGAVFAGAMDGHLRAYDGATGAVIWDYDTAIEYETLSGATGFGGSLGGGAGPVFKDGMMYINSGYGINFHMPGNVLLAFTIDKTQAQR